MTVKIINFPFCNVSSIVRFFDSESIEYGLFSEQFPIDLSDCIILPGVGTFVQGINFLDQINMIDSLRLHAANGGKIIGICLGMQLLLSSSDESPGVHGLNIIPGHCKLISASGRFLVPHIGWNEITLSNYYTPVADQVDSKILEQCFSKDFYFVHSYVANLDDMMHSLAYFDHPKGRLIAAVCCSNVYGFQFHPEKSGSAGYELIRKVLS